MVSSTTNSPAVLRKSSDLKVQVMTLPKGSLSPNVTRKQKRVERRHTVALSRRNSIFRDMRLFAKSLSKGSTDSLDKENGPGDLLVKCVWRLESYCCLLSLGELLLSTFTLCFVLHFHLCLSSFTANRHYNVPICIYEFPLSHSLPLVK